jgi:hypothetical protein
MYNTSLFINDFAMHDSSRDLVLANTQQAAELKLLLGKEAEKASAANESMKLLEEQKERTDGLLYQLLPKAVADALRSGRSAMSTCTVSRIECEWTTRPNSDIQIGDNIVHGHSRFHDNLFKDPTARCRTPAQHYVWRVR